MSTAAALDFTYEYPFASAVGDSERGFGLRLATCGAHQEHPYFFEGLLRQPRCIGDMLLVLSDVVRRHFFLPRITLLDPVVTSSEEMLRFEGFSGCCGVYARVDLQPEAFKNAELQERGTTNVDFNNPMRAALTRLRDREEARLAVGQDEVSLLRGEEKVVEKKVKLPLRWIKGFSEVQAYQPGLTLKWELSAAEARKFIRGLPRGNSPKQPTFITEWGKTLRLSPREKPGAVRIMQTDRIRVLEPLLGAARRLRIWAEEESQTSGWEVQFDIGRFFLMVSPEVYRGFSGEGQVLEKLATGKWEEALPQVQAQLSWQAKIDVNDLADRTGIEKTAVESALAVLGSRGIAGYDVATGMYFHRVLPFELEKVEVLQPRLQGARKLLAEKKVKLIPKSEKDHYEYAVEGSGVTHSVRISDDTDKCTCPWFSKHQGQRGPCKHILAARMVLEEGEPS